MQSTSKKRLLVQKPKLFNEQSGEFREIPQGDGGTQKAVGDDADILAWTKEHPVSHVQWVESEVVYANDYNPNKVAPPEMKLLELSIREDGFTQPIVVWRTEYGYEVVDGFHRQFIGKKMGLSHLPVVILNDDRLDRGDRIASTIRHNRARGKHQVQAMSEIIVELSRRNWSDARIARELGMDADELLRLKQITGLAELFADQEFSEAWEVEE